MQTAQFLSKTEAAQSAIRNQKSAIKRPLWLIRLTNYEYWPWLLVYSPMLVSWLWHAARSGSLAWFTAVNPGLREGGFYGESKKAILDLIPAEFKPTTLLISRKQEPLGQLRGLHFPLIAKPDVGERGNGVAKILTAGQLADYHQNAPTDYLIQPFIDFKIELAVLWSRLPDEPAGRVSSVTMKEFLAVTGDGQRTLGELISASDRARFQEKRLRLFYEKQWATVLPAGQKMELESIGNHCRGTRFIDANWLIDARLEAVFERISGQIAGFQYGRFDLRVASLADLLDGKNIRIVELNGVSADPAHIYDGSHGLFRTWRDLFWHWSRIAEIGRANLEKGIRPARSMAVWRKFRGRNL